MITTVQDLINELNNLSEEDKSKSIKILNVFRGDFYIEIAKIGLENIYLKEVKRVEE